MVIKSFIWNLLFSIMPLLFHMSYDALGFLLQNLLRVPEDLTNVLVGTHCVVEYDGLSYQRLILDVYGGN